MDQAKCQGPAPLLGFILQVRPGDCTFCLGLMTLSQFNVGLPRKKRLGPKIVLVAEKNIHRWSHAIRDGQVANGWSLW